ncbi:MAG TPA: L17 family ribosomal protein, partial [Pirellulales bacterium]
MFRNLIKALFLTEETDERQAGEGAPKIKGRIVTTLQKAKEVRPMVEKCITIAKKALVAGKAAEPFATTAERNSEGWQKWRQSEDHKKWSKAMSPVVTARRRVAAILGDVGDKHSKGDKRAVRIL